MRNLALVLACLTTACGGVAGSGTSKTETRQVPEFRALHVSGAVRFEVQHGDTQSLEITADDNLLSLLTSEVENGRLTIKPTRSIRPKTDIVVRATVRELTEVGGSGSITGEVHGVRTDAFKLDLSGSARLTLHGKARSLRVDLSGSGRVDADALDADEVRLAISGSGDADVHAVRTLDVQVSGSGTVRYRGDPKVTESISGSGRIVRK